ncbi:GNAT family N-acetyltransferase [Winogradskyella sp. PG-2]|uniref:GNAT family N-acetyltransferase n=1 Tax=Winogradskyella sp. PG-2 TaxID=754409 RepID=UPI00045874E0|nr:GNAT family N-acetyltransferase [Winogradskyella sp. PG-2]BAO74309.1 GCN5-related N-acetyltransferase [Winogradskyella sp. PG-2]
MKIIAETNRLILRNITESDAQDLFELDSNPKVHEFLGNNPVKHIDECKAYINSIKEQYKSSGMGRIAVIKKDTHEFIGWSGIKYEQNLRKEFNYYDMGYRLKEKFWGKGYATEAALASLDYGFKDLKLEEINAAADINHIASNTILKKIGMEHSGTFEYKGTVCNWYKIINSIP